MPTSEYAGFQDGRLAGEIVGRSGRSGIQRGPKVRPLQFCNQLQNSMQRTVEAGSLRRYSVAAHVASVKATSAVIPP